MTKSAASKPAPANGDASSALARLDQSALLGLVGYNCRRASLHVLRVFDERMTRFKLSPVEYSLLILVQKNPGVTQRRLSRALAIDPPNMVTLQTRLIKRGLLGRKRNPEDRRSQFLALTAEGERLCARAEQAVNQLENDATAALSDAERAEVIRLLQKIFLPRD